MRAVIWIVEVGAAALIGYVVISTVRWMIQRAKDKVRGRNDGS